MASFSLDEVLEPSTPAGHPSSHTPVVTPPKKSFSLDEALGEQEAPKGFFANLKNPLDLWMQESLPANIYKSIANHKDLWKKAEVSRAQEEADKQTLSGVGQFSNNPRAVAEAKARVEGREAAKPTIAKMWEEAKKDPGAAGAGLVNAIVADPWLLMSAFGGPTGPIATRAAGGAAMGAVTNVAVEAAREQAIEGRVRLENMVAPAQVGAVLGGAGNAAFGPRGVRRPSVRVTDPKQLFPDDAAHAAFEEGFRRPPEPGTSVAAIERPRPAAQELIEPGSREWQASDTAKALGLAGLGTGLLALEDQDEAALIAMAAGGIKAKGGMWHPEAISRLAKPLFGRLTNRSGGDALRDFEAIRELNNAAVPVKESSFKADLDAANWSQDKISKYLNRYAGTADDPLKDIVLPSGKTWEEVTGSLTRSRSVETVRREEPNTFMSVDVPAGERIWELDPYGNQANQRDLTSYLSHVGDYLRQNVSPDKLPQYDLVRAVKETAKNDARVAKEMEKARAQSTAQLPVFKEYPESGMKWVELKLPEKLTPEQLKGVKKNHDYDTGKSASVGIGSEDYVALGSEGKPLRNSYTDQIAHGRTPEEAWLAGRLAEEGNTMGHCVGGYCKGVASGESRILSLRDKKGESHVTVEVVPPDVRTPTNSPEHFARVQGGELLERWGKMKQSGDRNAETKLSREIIATPEFQQWIRRNPEDIAQIKGKQNKAPDKRYLPFVQDFVKGGKWGEVGDLEGTGLLHVKQEGQASPVWKEGLPSALQQRWVRPGFYTQAELRQAALQELPINSFKKMLAEEHPNVSIDLRESKSGAITLANIELKATTRDKSDQPVGRGLGQQAISEITSYADANNRGMILTASGVEGGPPTPKLVEIYKRFGFEEAAYQPFPDISVNMYRNPKGGSQDVSKAFAGTTEESLRGVQGVEPGGAGRPAGEMGREGLRPQGPGIDQAGNIDKRLLFGLTAAGLGGALGAQFLEDDPIRGMLWGAAALGVLPFIAPMARTLAVTADPALGMLSTRIKNISESIHRRVLDFERGVLAGTTRYISAAAPFLRELGRSNDLELKRAITSNDSQAIKAALLKSGNPALIQGWMQTRQALDEVGKQLTAAGRISSVLPDYFPRVVKDLDGLLEYLGTTPKAELEKVLADAQRKAAANGGLSQVEQSRIVNSWLQGHMKGGKPGFAKGRSIRQVTDDLMPFYADPAEAYTSYINAAVNDLEKTRFFGKHLAKKNNSILPDESIGNLLKDEIDNGRISYAQSEELKRLLLSRFGPEDSKLPEGARNTIQMVQNLSYAGLLGNLVSAATQMGDSAMSIYAAGLGPTLGAVGRKITGRMDLKAEDLGIVNHISDEFTSQLKSAQFLQSVFKWSGFSLIDRLGKDILTQASYTDFKNKANSVGGRRDLAEKYGEAYGPDFPQLVSDLQSGQRTALTDSLVFANVSRMQPLTRLEAPELYNMAPATRPLYMLKRWMLKQGDVIRRDSYDEWRKGHQVKAVGNLVKLATVLGISGMAVGEVKDWLLGKDPDEKEWMDKFADNVLKTFGWSSYAVKQAESGHPLKAVGGIVAPPYDMWDKIVTLDPKALDYLPIVGRMLRGHFEDKDEAKEKKMEETSRRRMEKILEGK